MRQEEKDIRQRESEASRAGDRKPYLKPAFLREQIFETMALSCGKSPSRGGQCERNRKNS
jgi:hypothetical protein